MSVTFEELECWWCLYLKSQSTTTSRRKLWVDHGKHTIKPQIIELIMCQECDDELSNLSLMDQIKLIVDYKADLKDWLTNNRAFEAMEE